MRNTARSMQHTVRYRFSAGAIAVVVVGVVTYGVFLSALFVQRDRAPVLAMTGGVAAGQTSASTGVIVFGLTDDAAHSDVVSFTGTVNNARVVDGTVTAPLDATQMLHVIGSFDGADVDAVVSAGGTYVHAPPAPAPLPAAVAPAVPAPALLSTMTRQTPPTLTATSLGLELTTPGSLHGILDIIAGGSILATRRIDVVAGTSVIDAGTTTLPVCVHIYGDVVFSRRGVVACSDRQNHIDLENVRGSVLTPSVVDVGRARDASVSARRTQRQSWFRVCALAFAIVMCAWLWSARDVKSDIDADFVRHIIRGRGARVASVVVFSLLLLAMDGVLSAIDVVKQSESVAAP
jgi:hypothetical protein